MRVYLIRHGQSYENTSDLRQAISVEHFRRLVAASHTSELTPTGIEQAQQAAAHLATLGLTQLYSSPYLRAQQTAAIVSAAVGLPVVTINALHEINPLIPPVLRRNRMRSLRSLYVRGYLHQMWPHRPDPGETWWAVRQRIATVWRQLNVEWRPSSRPALVAHRGFIWSTLRYLDNLPGWRVVRRDFDNAGISEVEQV